MMKRYDPEIPKAKYARDGEKEWDRLVKDRPGELLYFVHDDILKRHIRPDDDVIELGAGAGRFTKDIVDMCAALTVADLSEVQLEINKSKMKELGLFERIKKYMLLDISEMSEIADESYDVAVCTGGSINYLFDKEDHAVSEMLRILKPGGRLILGAMSLIGCMLSYLDGVRCEKDMYGMEAAKWMARTGMQDGINYPSLKNHLVHIMTSRDMDALFAGKPAKMIEKSSAGLFTQSGNEALENAKQDREFWEFLVEREIEFTKLPGTLDCGMNLIYVVEKS